MSVLASFAAPALGGAVPAPIAVIPRFALSPSLSLGLSPPSESKNIKKELADTPRFFAPRRFWSKLRGSFPPFLLGRVLKPPGRGGDGLSLGLQGR